MSDNLPAVRATSNGEVLELLGLKADHIHSRALLLLADRYGLDPLLKEIVVIPGRGPFVGVRGAISVALRSGLLDGLEADDTWETDSHWCVRCIVWRKDMRHPAAKVIGRVAKNEKKEWPLEIARARAIRAALSYAFNIHDDYGDTDDNWQPPPIEDAAGITIGEEDNTGRARRIDTGTGEVLEADEPAGSGAAGDTTIIPAGPDVATAPDTQPATRIVGGHSLAQRIAIAARHAGIEDDDDRHAIIRAVTGGVYERGSDIPEDEADSEPVRRIFAAFAGLADGTVYLSYTPDGAVQLFKRKP